VENRLEYLIVLLFVVPLAAQEISAAGAKLNSMICIMDFSAPHVPIQSKQILTICRKRRSEKGKK
jgi:hypothetical protein